MFPVASTVFLVTVLTKQLWWRDFSAAQEIVFSSFSLLLTRLSETGIVLCWSFANFRFITLYASDFLVSDLLPNMKKNKLYLAVRNFSLKKNVVFPQKSGFIVHRLIQMVFPPPLILLLIGIV